MVGQSLPHGFVFVAMPLLLLSAASAQEDRDAWSERELALIRSLSLDNLGIPPPDPSNRYADDPAAASLGARIFSDPRFSANGKISCASCHRADYGFTDDLPVGIGLAKTNRRTMPITGMAWQRWFFWDGRADSLWAQALGPIENPKEHGISRTRCAQLVSEHYWDAYEKAIGRLPDVDASALSPLARPSAIDQPAAEAWEAMSEQQRGQITEIYVNTGKALAAFVRTLKPAPSPFDIYARALSTGDERGIRSLTEPQKKGLRLFIGKGKCINCHNGPLFSNGEFHHVGAPDKRVSTPDRGRGAVIDSLAQAEFGYFSQWSDADPKKHGAHVRFLNADPGRFQRAFKTPGLRNVAGRPPYMHAGQFATLSDLLKHYRNVAGKQLVDEIFHVDLSDEELGQLESFLHALSAPKGDH